MEIPVVSTSIIILAVIAIVNRVKDEIAKAEKEIPNYWYTIMAFAIGGAVYAVVQFAPEIVFMIFFIGLAASGIFDIFKPKT
jgi:Fe2+ transport system protein B